MVTVAVAGGGGGIGSDIVQAILKTNKHEVIVLSRSSQPLLTKQGVDVKIVDYGSVEQLEVTLRGVHTVISCMAAYGTNSTAAELALLEAAKKAHVARFVPSEWNSPCHDVVDLYLGKEIVWKAVQSSGLEYTRFINGLWMNVWGPCCVRDEEEALGAYKDRPPFAIDLKAGTAIIPGDPSQKMVLTKTQDVGRFVAAALDLSSWEPESRIAGDTLTFTEVIQLVKNICGKDLRITHMSVENLQELLKGDRDSGERFYYQLLLAVALGRMDFEPTLNDLCPDIKPVSTAEYIKRHWTCD
jgi:nucleoside-diphosphate-sugar epimerase